MRHVTLPESAVPTTADLSLTADERGACLAAAATMLAAQVVAETDRDEAQSLRNAAHALIDSQGLTWAGAWAYIRGISVDVLVEDLRGERSR
jgi:hypothetical protein